MRCRDNVRWTAWKLGQERTRAAVNLVLHDIGHELGTYSIRIEFEDPPKLRLGVEHGWIVGAKTKIALGGDPAEAPWEYFVLRTAEDIQEVVQEDSGLAVPHCPQHEHHALNADIVSDVASWCCPESVFKCNGSDRLGDGDEREDS